MPVLECGPYPPAPSEARFVTRVAWFVGDEMRDRASEHGDFGEAVSEGVEAVKSMESFGLTGMANVVATRGDGTGPREIWAAATVREEEGL